MKVLRRNCKALYCEENKIWVSRGTNIFAIDYFGNKVTKTIRVGNWFQNIVTNFRLYRQLTRDGVHHLVMLKNGNLFLTLKNKSLTISKTGNIISVFKGYVGHKPGHQGVCVTPDGTIFFGEYTINLDHKYSINLYRSVDNGINFQKILCFDKNVRHIHFIKYDKYEDCIWLGTGDADDECLLLKSIDNGNTWEIVGSGSQDWRAIGINFLPDYLIWGTDAGSVPDQNHLNKMDRKNGKLETFANVGGPCHGCATFKSGDIYISTGVEGGENENDRFARLFKIDNFCAKEIYKGKKDLFPFIVQYGVIRFPLGTENTDKVVFNTMALKKNGENIIIL